LALERNSWPARLDRDSALLKSIEAKNPDFAKMVAAADVRTAAE